ncbi:MAG: hypothetical protein L0Z50_26355, partial [Verrucomicrobiales bacterium]|nr:hypothetical protein [Verrucomicrobiales bacterium]
MSRHPGKLWLCLLLHGVSLNFCIAAIPPENLFTPTPTFSASDIFRPPPIIWSTPFTTPLDLDGWNLDVISENDGSPDARNFDLADESFAGPGVACWFEEGLGGRSDGLPTSRELFSMTTIRVAYMLQWYGGNNVLRLDRNPGQQSGTLSLWVPKRYSNLYVLAASGAASGGGPEVGTLRLDFTDGTSSRLISFNASGLANRPGLSVGSFGRNTAVGPGFAYDNAGGVGFGMYETSIDLRGLGLDQKALKSITFFKPGGANPPDTVGIFA